MLHYIKRKLGVGQVAVSDNNAEFRIRNRDDIVRVILPIFDKYPLLTSKYYNYNLFKQAAVIMCDTTLCTTTKHELLNKLKNLKMPNNYFSPA